MKRGRKILFGLTTIVLIAGAAENPRTFGTYAFDAVVASIETAAAVAIIAFSIAIVIKSVRALRRWSR